MKEDERLSLISLAVKDLGLPLRYGNLLLWARLRGYSEDNVNSLLKAAIKRNIIQPSIEIRCPNCGAHLGEYNNLSEIPSLILCTDCNRKWSKDRDLKYSIEIVFSLTRDGLAFFRKYIKRSYEGKKKQKDVFEGYLRSIFKS